ncbi:MAG: ribonuclease HII [Clostridia bacterium]|nr:ribonuclease HII [Clostridia bacterium]
MKLSDRAAHADSLLAFESAWRTQGVTAGMDEAGRGPLAGPVVAACVVMPPEPVLPWVDDSKKLSEKRREALYDEILQTALQVGVGIVSAADIDRLNILEATRAAMRKAADQVCADFFLIDAVTSLSLAGQEVPIIRGDAQSYSIAAASIVAKVTRDRLLREMDARYPGYGFAQHKGYGTAAHIEALKKLGPCPEHRRSFIGHFVV